MTGGIGGVVALAALFAGEAVAQSPPPPARLAMIDVKARVSGLRSAKGQVLACLTDRPETFPDCKADPDARSLKVSANGPIVLDFGAVPPGLYAISLFHDENGNGKLDKRLMIPREGYGFSRDAPVMMKAPSFRSAAFEVGGAETDVTIKMRYLF